MLFPATLLKTNSLNKFLAVAFAFVLGIATANAQVLPQNADWKFQLRYRSETSAGSGRFHTLLREETWQPTKTAIIVCDVWDTHHSINAVRRVEEIAPRIDAVLKQARAEGATIIHAPSDCMDSYTEHPARHRAMSIPIVSPLPPAITEWRSRIDSEKSAAYPVDQSDGGSDDDPSENAAWAKELQAQGRNPGTPWKAQSSMIAIDGELDFVSDRGDEVWSILQSRGIENVILVGVHTNMCVLGRPFGLRNMVAAGKRVALLRDLTDTMYNPQRWPFVNHHTGTDRIIEYIEKHVCATLTSDQFIGGKPHRFASDDRPLVAIVMAEDEYETERTLPRFAEGFLGNDFRVALVFASDNNPNEIPGLEILDQADVAVISVRRRPLKSQQMAVIRRFVQSGKPVIGIRTASHAFVLREAAPPEGLEAWPEFDAQVFGGNYIGHHGNEKLPKIEIVPESAGYTAAFFSGIDLKSLSAGGSLYKTSPLASGAQALLRGSISGQSVEPVAWVFKRADGGKSFYTSLGHKLDFNNAAFNQLLFSSVRWATGLDFTPIVSHSSSDNIDTHWRVVTVPSELRDAKPSQTTPANRGGWIRCYLRLEPNDSAASIILKLENATGLSVWLNGRQLAVESRRDGLAFVSFPRDGLDFHDLNLLVIRSDDFSVNSLSVAPILSIDDRERLLSGRWQFRVGNDPSFASVPLPPKFAASPDVVFFE